MEIKLIQRKHETVKKRKRFYLFFPFSSIKLTIKIEKKQIFISKVINIFE